MDPIDASRLWWLVMTCVAGGCAASVAPDDGDADAACAVGQRTGAGGDVWFGRGTGESPAPIYLNARIGPTASVCSAYRVTGPCEIWSVVSTPSNRVPLASYPNAGRITVQGAGGASLADDPDAPGNIYPDATGLSARGFEGGDTIEFVAAGGEVPAFAQTMTMPAPIAVPPPPNTVARGADLPLTWSGGDVSGRVLVEIREEYTGSATGLAETIRCRFPTSDGHALVPADALRDLTNQPDGRIALVVVAAVERTIQAGAYSIRLLAAAGPGWQWGLSIE